MPKRCSACGGMYPPTPEFFRKSKNGRNGLSSKCKVCDRMYQKDNDLRKKYNISLEDYASMHDTQDGRCAICFKRDTKMLAVDHDHQTGQVRELLCQKCNMALGLIDEDIDIMFMMIEYAKYWHNKRLEKMGYNFKKSTF